MRLKDLMIQDVEIIRPGESAETAWNRMNLSGIRHLVVMNERNSIVGVISDRDLGGSNGEQVRYGRRVDDLMTTDIVTANPDTTVKDAANLLRGYAISCLPVLNDNGKLIGIVTVTDLLEVVGQKSAKVIRQKTTRPNIRSMPPTSRRRP